jgi:acetyl esterase
VDPSAAGTVKLQTPSMRGLQCLLLAMLLWPATVVAATGDELRLDTPEGIAEFRAQVEGSRPAVTRFELPRVEDLTLALEGRQIAIRLYDPGGSQPQPLLIYVHGGCWVAGSLDSHDEISRYLAVETGALVAAVDYRLAPEFPYPAAHQDVYDAAQWLWDHSETLGVDRARFAISGESAGAYFAAATALRAADAPRGPKFAFVLLVYAALEGGGSAWESCKRLYFPKPDDAYSRYASPLWAEDLAGLPPTFDIYGEREPSRAEQELFMRKLAEQGVMTRTQLRKGVGHDVVRWLAVEGDLGAQETAVAWIKAGFAAAKAREGLYK